MAQLGEVLGGMLTDVVRARMAADSLTAQAIETYRANPALASMSVPRVTVSQVTVKLSFAVSEVDIPPRGPVEPEAASGDWNAVVRERILPLLPEPARPAAVEEALAAPLRAPARPLLEVTPKVLSGTVEGDLDPLVERTVSAVMGSPRTQIPADVRKTVTAEIRREAVAFADLLRQRQMGDQALHSRLEIDVVSDKVAETKPEAVQTLELTLSLADVEDVLAGPGQLGR